MKIAVGLVLFSRRSTHCVKAIGLAIEVQGLLDLNLVCRLVGWDTRRRN